MKKPRLLIVIPHIGRSGGGVSEAARLLTHALNARGRFEIHVLTQDDPADVLALKTWPSVHFHMCRSYGPSRFGFSPAMVGHMIRNRYSVVHIHGIWTFHLFSAAIALLRGMSVVVSPHGMLEPWILARSKMLKKFVGALYQNMVLRHAAFIHALTSKEEQDIRNVFPANKIFIAPNFVPKMSTPLKSPTWAHMVGDRKRVFLFFGRIHEKKGWRNLLSAWQVFCGEDATRRVTSALVFCGWIDGAIDFEEQVSSVASTTGNIYFVGPQYGDERVATYHAADFFILPSQSEGLPMAVLEAAACHSVVLMSRACNLATMLDEGLAIDCGVDQETILDALRYANSLSGAHIAQLRVGAARHIEEIYSESIVSKSIEKMLLEAASRGEHAYS